MKPFRYFVLVLSLTLPVAVAMAAPPRLTAVGDTLPPPSGEEPAANQPVPAWNSEDKSAVAEKQGNADKTTAGQSETSATKETKSVVVSTPATEAAPVVKKESWWTRLFHKRPAKQDAGITRKKIDELVNTDKRHKEAYDVLRTADFERFDSGYDGRWHVQSSNVMCRMKQKLPGYGYVEFRQGVDQPLEFALYVEHPPAGSGLVHVSSQPPLWRHYVKKKQLGKLELNSGGNRAVTAPSDWSRRLLIELSEGMQPVLRFWDAADASDDVEVFVSALQFQDSLTLFHKCLSQLLHYDYQEANARVIHFNPDSSKIRRNGYQQLDEMLEIVKADKGISDINLKIYTYRSGLARYNFRLATRRAQGVRDYLMKHGIKADRINIHIFTRNKTQMRKLGYNDTDVYIGLERNKK